MNVKNAAAAANAGEHQHVLEVELASLQACIHADIAAYQHPESNQQAYAIQAAISHASAVHMHALCPQCSGKTK